MKKIKMKNLVACIVSLAICCSLSYAQLNSAIKESSAGLFSTDIDNAVSTTGWQGVKLDRFILSANYGYLSESYDPAHLLNVGGMFNAKNVVLGFAYMGAFTGNSTATVTSTQQNNADNTWTSSFNFPVQHDIKFLTGFMVKDIPVGVRAGLEIGGEWAKNRGSDVGKFSQSSKLSFKPNLMVGTKIPVEKYVFKPTIDFSFLIGNEAAAGQNGTRPSVDVAVQDQNGDLFIQKDIFRNYTPAVTLALDIDLPSNLENVSWGTSVSYGFGIKFMPKKSTYKNENNNIESATYATDSGQTHTLKFSGTSTVNMTPSFTVKFKAEMLASYLMEKTGGTTAVNNVTDSPSQDLQTLTLEPTLYAGFNFKIAKIANWYAGMAFMPFSYVYTHTSQYNEIGDRQENRNKIHNFKNPSLAKFGTGFGLQPVDTVEIMFGFLFQPTTATKFTTLNDVFSNFNIKLGFSWKPKAKNSASTQSIADANIDYLMK